MRVTYSKLILVFAFTIFTGASLLDGQTPAASAAPVASPSPAKHRVHKKAESKKTAPTSAETTSASSTTQVASPSPSKRRTSRKAAAQAAASPQPAASTSASPRRSRKAAAQPTAASIAGATASPLPRSRVRKTKETGTATAAATPVATATTTPRRSVIGSFFRKKTEPMSTPAPAAENPSSITPVMATPMPGGGYGKVWVNTKTHIYHREGSRFYGKTKEGKYVTEQEAIDEGDRAAAKGD